jgi:hypothetical protein
MSSIRRSVALGLTGGCPLAVTVPQRPDPRQTDLVYFGRSPTECLEQVRRTVDTTSAVTPADRLDNCATPSADLLGFPIPRSLDLSNRTQANRSFSRFQAPGSGVPLAGALRLGAGYLSQIHCALRRACEEASKSNEFRMGHDHLEVLELWAH